MDERAEFQAFSGQPYMGLAPYASFPERSRGRLYPEPGTPTRNDFQRDRDRIIHADAFRRLEGKTQVFVSADRSDHLRNRYSHTMEVAQLAEGIARQLSLNPDLAIAVALAHDLGHPPFGHGGETMLTELMEPYGGFDHNAQSIRMVTSLEAKYANFDGINLTWETLEGIAKHNGPVDHPPRALKAYDAKHDLELHSHASAEAQVAAIADDIAYINHDLQDGLRAGLFAIEDVLKLPLAGDIYRGIMKQHPKLAAGRLIFESKRRIINGMVADLVEQTRHNIESFEIHTVDDVRGLGQTLVHFSPQVEEERAAIYEFLLKHMYRHKRVTERVSDGQKVLKHLFETLMKNPLLLPQDEWQEKLRGASGQQLAEIVCDYIAGMTDEFASELAGKL